MLFTVLLFAITVLKSETFFPIVIWDIKGSCLHFSLCVVKYWGFLYTFQNLSVFSLDFEKSEF